MDGAHGLLYLRFYSLDSGHRDLSSRIFTLNLNSSLHTDTIKALVSKLSLIQSNGSRFLDQKKRIQGQAKSKTGVAKSTDYAIVLIV